MAQYRLINCGFINSSSFKVNISNRAKLLYLMMIAAADDLGFVDSTQEIINAFEKNDNELDKVERLELLENTYNTALDELLNKGLIYEFRDNHNNRVHLIRHWFFHNKYKPNLWTNYKDFRDKVNLKNGEWLLGRKQKEDKTKENNINQDNTIENVFESKEKEKVDDVELTEEDLPFAVDLKSLKGD